MNRDRSLVLIVDDQLDNRWIYSKYFATEDDGLEVDTAGSGAEALEKARQRRPDVVVLDIAMPGMTGLDVARRLRAHPPTRDVPIVFVSAYVSEEETRRSAGVDYSAFVRRGRDAFIAKPCLPEALLAEVKRVLAS